MAGEAPGIGDGVEDAPAPGMGGDEEMVLALVEVESGLLTGPERDREAAGARGDDQLAETLTLTLSLGGRGSDPAPLGLEALHAGGGGVVGAVDGLAGKEAGERLGHEPGEAGHAEGEALDDAHRSVAVHHEPGEPVGRAPAEAVGLDHEPGRSAVVQGGGEPAAEEGPVHHLVGTGEQATGDAGARVIEPSTEGMAGRVEHVHRVAGRPRAPDVRDLAPVHPRVAGTEPAIASALEDDLGRSPTSSAGPPP